MPDYVLSALPAGTRLAKRSGMTESAVDTVPQIVMICGTVFYSLFNAACAMA
jgi:hypothetical protein